MPEPAGTCTATFTGRHLVGGGTVQCTRDAHHPGNHVGPKRGSNGRALWEDHQGGATPHRQPAPVDFLTVTFPDGRAWIRLDRLTDGRVMCCLCCEYTPRDQLAPRPRLSAHRRLPALPDPRGEPPCPSPTPPRTTTTSSPT